jgi:SAM-dependent methyltransferase
MGKSPEDFNHIANTIFAPIYPVIARTLLSWTGRRKGVCCDLGAGPGHLAMAIARQSDFSLLALDSDSGMTSIAMRNIRERALEDRIVPVAADVHCLPLRDGSVDLAVSRGSLPFWRDRPRAFEEIERVLTPDGIAYIGGGFGSAALEKEVFAKMRENNPDWDADVKRRSKSFAPESLERDVVRSGVKLHRVISDESGTWLEIRKS